MQILCASMRKDISRYFQVLIDFCFSLRQQSKKLWRLITKVPLWHLCQLQIFASFEIPPLAFACNRVAGQQKIFLVQKKIGFLNFFLQTFRASKNLSCWLDFFGNFQNFKNCEALVADSKQGARNRSPVLIAPHWPSYTSSLCLFVAN